MCGRGLLYTLSMGRKKKVSLSGMYLKGSESWKLTVLGESGGKDERLLLKVTLGPGFLCRASTSMSLPAWEFNSLPPTFAFSFSQSCLSGGKSKPFLPPAGVRLNTEMATGKRQRGKTKKKNGMPASLAGLRCSSGVKDVRGELSGWRRKLPVSQQGS